MTIKKDDLLEKCLETFEMSLPQFAEHIDIPKSTLQNWKEGKISAVGALMLRTLLENHALKRKQSVLDVLKEILKED